MEIEYINPETIYQPVGRRYTQVVRATGTTQVHVSGIVPLDRGGSLRGRRDMDEQGRVVAENLGAALASVGATPENVVRINVFTLDCDRYRHEGHPHIMRLFSNGLPAATAVQVVRLAEPEWLLEIEATALLD